MVLTIALLTVSKVVQPRVAEFGVTGSPRYGIVPTGFLSRVGT